MFLLLDCVEHECRNRFAGQRETHPGSGTFPAAIGRIVLLGETWRPCNCPVETAVSEDEAHNPIGNSREMCRGRKNEQPVYPGTPHRTSCRKRAVVEERAWFEDLARS